MREPASHPGGPSFTDPAAPGFTAAAVSGGPHHWHPAPGSAPGRPPLATAYPGYVPHHAPSVPVVPAVSVRPYSTHDLEWERRTLRDTVRSTSQAFAAEMLDLERTELHHQMRCQQRALEAKRAQVHRTLGLDPSVAVARENQDVPLQASAHSYQPSDR